jgi:hypothetical protein
MSRLWDIVKHRLVQYQRNPVTGGNTLIGVAVQTSWDVLVYGSTASGLMAAIGAARDGKRVVVVSPDPRIGGVLANGLSAADVGTALTNPSQIYVGLANEFYYRLAREYAIGKQQFYATGAGGQPFSGESKVIYSVLQQMLVGLNITIFLNNNLIGVTKTGVQIGSCAFDGIGSVSAKQFIDASYEGDLLALAGCSYSIGREANATYGESYNGIQATTVATFSGNIDPYVTAGVSASGLLPGITATVLGSAGTSDSHVQAFNYRLPMTTAGAKVAIPAPTVYNAQLYELLGRDFVANGAGIPTSMSTLFGNYAVPNSKYDVNNKYVVSSNYIGPETNEYLTAAPSRRAQIRQIHKDYILGLFQWIATDSRVPAPVKSDVAAWGMCADEFQWNGGFPEILYVREGRRLISDAFPSSGKAVLSDAEITSASNGFTNPIAFSYYQIDSHICQRVVVGGYVKNEGPIPTQFPYAGSPIPYNVLLPKQAECTNLLVTIAVAASHSAYCSIRMEPIQMAMGHAAGVAASIAIEKGVKVQSVDYPTLRNKMDIQQTRNSLFMGVDAGAGNAGTIVLTSWPVFAQNGNSNTIGANIASTTTSGATAVATPTITKSGKYRVFAYYPGKSGRQQKLTTTIVHADGTSTRYLNQSHTGQGGDWDDLGDYTFYSTADQALFGGTAHSVTFTAPATGGSSLINAVKFVPVELVDTVSQVAL